MLCKVTHCAGSVSAKTRPLSAALGWLGGGDCYLMCEYSGEIPCEYVQYTGLDVCTVRNSRNSLKEAGYLYV